ncbi:unnamed protein product [Allacma fusca]|uniref:Uncharacterized protein n=1 Tax=Allacma fusca TaxID=39272 RepID=A0A8J2JG57_9HEXA|nr:unnamed protein product [Allacma fusca]
MKSFPCKYLHISLIRGSGSLEIEFCCENTPYREYPSLTGASDCDSEENASSCPPHEDDSGLSGSGLAITMFIIIAAALVIVGCGWLCAMMGNFDLFSSSDGYLRVPLNSEENTDFSQSMESI